MDYKKLRIISYNSTKVAEEEYQLRSNSLSTFKTDLIITPYSIQKEERLNHERSPLFYLPLPAILILEDKILRNSKKIQSSNEIEGVRSTRKELQEAAKFKDTNIKVRFKGIVSQYLNIGDSKYEKIKKVEDFRAIYDNLFLDDVQEDELPAGK